MFFVFLKKNNRAIQRPSIASVIQQQQQFQMQQQQLQQQMQNGLSDSHQTPIDGNAIGVRLENMPNLLKQVKKKFLFYFFFF